MRERSSQSPRRKDQRPSTRQPILAGVLLLGLGALQIYAFGGFAMARYSELPGNGASDLTTGGIPIADDGFDRLVDSRSVAQRWLLRAQPDRDLAEGYLARAVRAESPDGNVREDLDRASAAARAATVRAPVDPVTLAAIPYVADYVGDTETAAKELSLAYSLVPYWPETAFIRSWTAMKAWGQLSAEQQELAKRDMRSGMERDAASFTAMIIAADFVDRSRDVLADDEEFLYALKIAIRDIEDREAQAAIDDELRAKVERWRQQQGQ